MSWVFLCTQFTPLSHTASHSTLKPHTHTHAHTQHPTRCTGAYRSVFLHSHEVSHKRAPTHLLHSHTDCAVSAHSMPTALSKASNRSNFQRPVCLPPPPTLTSQRGRGTGQEAAENQGEGWAEEGRVSSLVAVPLITVSQSSWGSLAPSTTRGRPRDNGIISGGRGCPRQGLRRPCLLPSIHPSAPSARLRRPGT